MCNKSGEVENTCNIANLSRKRTRCHQSVCDFRTWRIAVARLPFFSLVRLCVCVPADERRLFVSVLLFSTSRISFHFFLALFIIIAVCTRHHLSADLYSFLPLSLARSSFQTKDALDDNNRFSRLEKLSNGSSFSHARLSSLSSFSLSCSLARSVSVFMSVVYLK